MKDRGFTALKTNPFALRDKPETHVSRDVFTYPNGDISPAELRSAEVIIGTLREALGPDVGIATMRTGRRLEG